MPDDTRLDGDPNEDRTCFYDTSPTLKVVLQSLAMVADLIEAGNADDARALAVCEGKRIRSVLRHMEVQPLPEVDVSKTGDVADRDTWVYKDQRGSG